MSEQSNALGAPEEDLIEGPEVEDEALDDGEALPEPEQEAEPDLKAEARARQFGWKPKREWKGDQSGWVPVETFLDLPSTARREREALQDRVDRFSGFMEETTRRQKDDATRSHAAEIKRIRDEIAQAGEVGDVQRINERFAHLDQVEQRAAERNAPPPQPQGSPEVHQYRADNEWTRDPFLWAQAVEAVNVNPEIQKMSPADQLRYAEATVRRFFPSAFKATPAPDQQRQASRVEGGGIGARGSAKRGWGDIPKAERDGIEPQIDGRTYADKAEAAAAYWKWNA